MIYKKKPAPRARTPVRPSISGGITDSSHVLRGAPNEGVPRNDPKRAISTSELEVLGIIKCAESRVRRSMVDHLTEVFLQEEQEADGRDDEPAFIVEAKGGTRQASCGGAVVGRATDDPFDDAGGFLAASRHDRARAPEARL